MDMWFPPLTTHYHTVPIESVVCECFLYIVSGLCVTATAGDMSGSANVSRLRMSSDHNVEVGF